jgi:DNA-binding PadR family transcriptional regulator
MAGPARRSAARHKVSSDLILARSALTMQESHAMHKNLLLLGLLLSGPKTGYDLHRIVREHGDLYADLKKANVYYLLDRLAKEGYLDVQTEPGARGPRGERLIYSLTERGREKFSELLQQVLRTYEPVPSNVGAAVVFLPHLPEGEAIRLLEERRQSVAQRRAQVAAFNSEEVRDTLVGLALDHLLALIDADLAWTDRALDRLRHEAVTDRVEHERQAAQDMKSR